MGAQLLLLVGAASIAAAGVMLFFVVTLGAGTTTGVARGLEMIEESVSPQDVERSELSASDRLIIPFYTRMKRLALRFSPSGTSARLSRLLDLAGTPETLTRERLLGFKGVGLLLGGVLGLFYGGVSLKGFPARSSN